MKKCLLIFALPALLSSSLLAQTIPPNEIRPSATSGQVLTTVTGGTPPSWQPGASATGTAPITVNGVSGTPETTPFTIACPECGSGAFQFQPTPPQSGQFVVIYPTAVTGVTGGLGPGCGSTPLPTGSLTLPPSGNPIQSSAFMTNTTCGNGLTNNGWGANWTFTGALESQAPEVLLANVTAVFAFSENSVGPSFAGTSDGSASCTGPGNSANLTSSGGNTLQQFTGQITATGAQVDSITCAALLIYSNSPPTTVSMNVPAIGLMVFYTGTAPPVTNALTCLPPFFCSEATGLGVDPLGPFFTLTTTGSGDATYSGGILNIPPSSGSGSISVNGTSVSSPNLNGTTPAAPSGSTNCTWAVSGSSVSCSIPATSSGGVTLTGPVTGSGTGTIATTITPTGVTAGSYTNPNITLNAAGQVLTASNGSSGGVSSITPGTNTNCSPLVSGSCTGAVTITSTGTGSGVSSLNSLSGALNLTSTGGTVTITPSGSSIDLEAPGTSGISQLTGDVTTPTGGGSRPATAVNLPGHITLTGTPSAGQVPTAMSPTAATWQTPASGGAGVLTQSLANDSSVGTSTGLLACYTNTNLGLVGTCSTTQSGIQGTNGNVPWAGVCISGCGTTGFATIQYAGPVSWICDDSVGTSADVIQPSITAAGECHQPAGESNPIPNENPESNSFFGLPVTANSGAGTAATINLIDFPFSRFAFPFGGIVMSQGGSSPFLTISHLGQQTSTYTIPFALTGNGLATTQVSGQGNAFTNYGLSTFGTSGRDTVLDSLSNGFGGPPTEMLALVGSQYQIPAGTTPGTSGNGATFTPPSISGTWAPGGISGDFCVGGTSGMYIIQLAGNTTQGTIPSSSARCDNPGHVIYFEIMPPSSGGPFTLTWASSFVNPPTVSLSSGGSPVLASFLFDGASYNCIIGCAGGSGGAVSSVFGRTAAVVASSGDYTVAQVTGAAPLASPAFTGIPTAPTAAALTNTTQLATTAFVTAALAAAGSAAGIVTYSGPSLTFTGTAFFPIGGGGLSSTTETNVDLASPASATVKNFTVQLSAAPGTGNSIAFTWRDNATSTAVTCTVSGSATSCSDLTDSFTASAGDLLDIQAVTSGTILSASTAVMGTQVGIAPSGGGSGALTQISKVVVSSASPTITFSGIAGTFSQLYVFLNGQSSSGSDDFATMQFNSDTSSDYNISGISLSGASSVAGFTTLAGTSAFIINMKSSSSGAHPGTGDCTIYSYANTAFNKQWTCRDTTNKSSFMNTEVSSGEWISTTAITSIVLQLNSGSNFTAGTTATLYGVQ
jgi:hypothetical protein